jgi:hypothetical protein
MRSAEWEGQDFTDLIGHIASGLYCGVFDRRGRELRVFSRTPSVRAANRN